MNRLLTWLVASPLAFATPSALRAQSTIIRGCNERLAGEVGVREANGALGDTVRVAVTVHSTSSIDAFGLTISFPTGLLEFVAAEKAGLTSTFTNLSAGESPGGVTVGGFTLGAAIPNGSIGQLAVLRFVVTAPGSGDFSLGSFVDDLAGYDPCESNHGTSPVTMESWGALKARFAEHAPRAEEAGSRFQAFPSWSR